MSSVSWIKLSASTFSDEKIQLIRQMPEGNNIVLFFIQLLTLAGRTNAGGEIFLNDELPYSNEALASLFEWKLTFVRLALEILQKFRMIQILDDGTIMISNWGKYQNLEGLEKIREQNRERVKRFRQRQIAQKNERLLSRYYDDSNKSSQSEPACNVTARYKVTQKCVTTPLPEEEEEKEKIRVPSLPSLPQRERQPAEIHLVTSKDLSEKLRQKLLSEGKDPAKYIVDGDEAKRLICKRILNGKDPSRPWSEDAERNLVRLLPIPRIEVERISWFRGLEDDGTPELKARRPVTPNGLMAYWADEYGRAEEFWQEICGWRERVQQAQKKEPPQWREFLQWKYDRYVRLPESFWDLPEDLRQEYEAGFSLFQKAQHDSAA